MSKYEKLFTPFTIKNTTFKNRIIMAPMGTAMPTYNGKMNDMAINYYTERAKGGAGLITLEAAAVTFKGIGWNHNLGVYNDSQIPGLKKLADSIHAAGAKVSLEIFHTGRSAKAADIYATPVAPSAQSARGSAQQPRAMSKTEIADVVRDFGQAARRAKEAGIDAVTVHMAHGYLIQQFLSPLSNFRTDEYGGSTENRCRFAVEVVKEIRKQVGDTYPVFARLSAHEYNDNNEGVNLEEAKKISLILEEAGVDMIDVSATGTEKGFLLCEASYSIPPLYNRFVSKALRETVSIPVTCVGKISTPEQAEELLQSGTCDFVTLGRQLIADPYFAQKAMEDRAAEIVPCIHCLQGCIGRFGQNLPISCTVNPETSRECQGQMAKAEVAKKVLVIGGGMSGMFISRLLTMKGHTVTLLEKSDVLGGQGILAATPRHKVTEIGPLVDFLRNEMVRLNVNVKLNTPFTKEEAAGYDVVVEATGANPVKFNLPGCENVNYYTAWEVLRKGDCEGQKVVVIGAGDVGLETAEFLLQNGKEVLVLEMLPEFGKGQNYGEKYEMFRRIRQNEFDIRTNCKVLGFEGKNLKVELGDIPMTFTDIDTCVLSVGSRPAAIAELSELDVPVYHIGDSVKIGRLYEALSSAYNVAAQI